MMSTHKRRASDYNGQPAFKGARTEHTESRLDQVMISNQ
jgi:hypothetical protein